MLEEWCLNIYTDWSSYPWPRRWGTGILFITIDPDTAEPIIEEIDNSYWYKQWRIWEMELEAVHKSLKEIYNRYLSEYRRIIIYTDATYVKDHEWLALYKWSKNWYTKSWWSPVLNAPIWKEINKLRKKIYDKHHKIIEFEWIKAHKDNEYNNQVDKLAKESAKSPVQKKINNVNVRKKKFKEEQVKVWSIEMQWQKMTIYIIDDEYLKIQKVYKYRYQVMTRNSTFYKKIDFIYSKILLSAGHTYYVIVNDNTKNPQVLKKIREIEKK